ncbi:branched-chain amino acid ABC transporter permease [Bradyrhizobium sp. G127]|uniref:branched-chain amino acid ABC transporter permease n=1 Tax=Bradyrhizobium sp. G127 TaxID=2904800 RepID=UPI001F4584ED|nr:branched-chain amino acid ABC transporter permease [Bradyrhizobium sp. G127]MCF2522702.1 branched-chain amino acid ABC transporter permease [Bradyrhizobium sp. G127]
MGNSASPPHQEPADRLGLSMRASHVLVAIFVIAALIFAAIGAAMGDTFFLRLATEALIFAGLALSVDILLGYTGLLSLGQALYFGMGAYISAVVLKEIPSFWVAMGIVLVASLIVGMIAGLIANRVRGVYFALVTFGLAQVAARAVYNTRALGASDGLIGVPIVPINLGVGTIMSNAPASFFIFTLGFIVVLYLICAYVLDTPFGRILVALRANERRVPFLGYSTRNARVAAYVLAAVVASLSGALYPMLRGFVSPELMFFTTSGNAVITVVTGGVGTLAGALYGGVILTVLKSVIGSMTEHHLIVIGLLFMATVIFLPKGLMGLVRPRIERMLGGGGR